MLETIMDDCAGEREVNRCSEEDRTDCYTNYVSVSIVS